eukprot:TRINITY_DN75333_c0_g1_i1.p1 TRINITY_DN75333_c0_g1~~TRINITY_DN75333_c0_g1_i1.p1  ORF type:complete len:409 (-),score=70.01 TRINITY_DN75333_c0_g1_i1:53-1279(-)
MRASDEGATRRRCWTSRSTEPDVSGPAPVAAAGGRRGPPRRALSDVTNVVPGPRCLVCADVLRGIICGGRGGGEAPFGCSQLSESSSSSSSASTQLSRAQRSADGMSRSERSWSRVQSVPLHLAGLLDNLSTLNPSLVELIVTFVDEKEYSDFLPRAEKASHVKSDYMNMQEDINSAMRTILVDWLAEVFYKCRLGFNVLFLTISLIDRYLSKSQVPRSELQLVGVAAASLAAKYEGGSLFTLKDWSYFTSDTYPPSQVLKTECSILEALDFRLRCPTTFELLERLLRLLPHDGPAPDPLRDEVARYVATLSLLDVRCCVHFGASQVAAAAVLLARELLGHSPAWRPAVAPLTGHDEAATEACATQLRRLLSTILVEKQTHQAINRMFAREEHFQASRVVASALMVTS